jgi:hypothetical protein
MVGIGTGPGIWWFLRRRKRMISRLIHYPVCELPRIPIPRTPVNKGKGKGHSPVELYPSHTLPPCRRVFLLWEELKDLRMQTCKEALRDGLNEFIFRTKAEEHLLAVGGDHVFAVHYQPVEAAAASYYVFERWPVDGPDYVVAAPFLKTGTYATPRLPL